MKIRPLREMRNITTIPKEHRYDNEKRLPQYWNPSFGQSVVKISLTMNVATKGFDRSDIIYSSTVCAKPATGRRFRALDDFNSR